MKVIDLYCGAGGFSEGFKEAGFDIILGVDIWETALKTFKFNHPNAKILMTDVRNLQPNDLPKCDVLIGSPPCVDFSKAKYIGTLHKKREIDLSMVDHFLYLVDKIKPKYWIMENVPSLKKYLFFVPFAILDAQDFGVPQRRKRIFIGNYPMPRRNIKKFGKDEVAPTILAWELCGGWKHGGHHRRFCQFADRKGYKPSPEIMKKYMGFPDDYVFFGNKQEKSIQIGNAVCPPISKAIAEAILEKERRTIMIDSMAKSLNVNSLEENMNKEMDMMSMAKRKTNEI